MNIETEELSVIIMLILIASWITNIWVLIKYGSLTKLALFTIVFPIGCVHGIMIWFGVL